MPNIQQTNPFTLVGYPLPDMVAKDYLAACSYALISSCQTAEASWPSLAVSTPCSAHRNSAADAWVCAQVCTFTKSSQWPIHPVPA